MDLDFLLIVLCEKRHQTADQPRTSLALFALHLRRFLFLVLAELVEESLSFAFLFGGADEDAVDAGLVERFGRSNNILLTHRLLLLRLLHPISRMTKIKRLILNVLNQINIYRIDADVALHERAEDYSR